MGWCDCPVCFRENPGCPATCRDDSREDDYAEQAAEIAAEKQLERYEREVYGE